MVVFTKPIYGQQILIQFTSGIHGLPTGGLPINDLSNWVIGVAWL